MSEIGLPVALAAGVLSFLSPCVLPLVPSYLSFVTGMTLEDLQDAVAVRDDHRPTVDDELPVAVAIGRGFEHDRRERRRKAFHRRKPTCGDDRVSKWTSTVRQDYTAFRRSRSASTCCWEDICASSRSSWVWSEVKSSSAPAATT